MEAALLWACWLVYVAAAVVIIWRERNIPGKEKVVMVFLRDCEEECEGILRHLHSFGRKAGCGIRLLVLDDGSHDETVKILDRISSILPGTNVIFRGRETPSFSVEVERSIFSASTVIDLRDCKHMVLERHTRVISECLC